MRFLLRGILAVIFLLAVSGGYLVWSNNRSMPPPDPDRLNTTLENSIRWLTEHRQEVLGMAHPMLWRMVQQAGDITGDARLKTLFSAYEQRYLEKKLNNIWRPLFYPNSWVPVRFEQIADYPYYNWHFVYAYTCDQELAKVPEIAAQNDAAFCEQFRYRFRPACATHQMMGLLLMKRSQCDDQAQVDSSIENLQQRIHSQLTWDPRVVDVYMQRVLMLVQSGAGDLVKPVWLHRLIDAQQSDGGWRNFMPLIPLGGGRSIGITRLPRIEAPKTDFHLTAQGILLFALLTQPEH